MDDGETETSTKFIYDGFHVIAEYDGGGTLLCKYVYGPGIDEPLAMIIVDVQAETWYYYHFNGLGSVIALTDENGDLVETYSYNVFGTPTIYDGDGDEISASAIGNPYMFTGRRYDEDTGLYYYRLRDYNPVLGRFMQNDPIGYAGGINLYRYCHNNPTNFVDPMGRGRMRAPGLTLTPLIGLTQFPSHLASLQDVIVHRILAPVGKALSDAADAAEDAAIGALIVSSRVATKVGDTAIDGATLVGHGAMHLGIEYVFGPIVTFVVIVGDDLCTPMGTDDILPPRPIDPNAPPKPK